MSESRRLRRSISMIILVLLPALVTATTPLEFEMPVKPLSRPIMESIFKNVPIGICLLKNRSIVKVNDYVLNLTGYSRDELNGQNTRMLYPTQKEYEQVEQAYQHANVKGTATLETRWARKDGTIRAVRISLTRIDDADIAKGVAATILDVTDRKEAEAALGTRTGWFLTVATVFCVLLSLLLVRFMLLLRQQRRLRLETDTERTRFRQFFNDSPVSMATYALDGKTFTRNRRFVEELGWTEADIPELADWFAAAYPDADYRNVVTKKWLDDIAQALATGHPVNPVEYRVTRKDGSSGWYLVGASIVTDMVLVSFLDISERRHAEETLRESGRRAGKQRTALADLALDEALKGDDIGNMCRRVAGVLRDTVGVARASVWLLDESRTRLECLTLLDAADNVQSGMVLDTESFPDYFAAITGESRVYAGDARHDPRTQGLNENYLEPLGITSMLDAGIILDGKLFGVVSCEHIGEPRTWLVDEEAFVSTIASIVAQFFANLKRLKSERDKERLQRHLYQSQKMEALGQLAGGIAHDFNNLLTVISGTAQLLQLEGGLTENQNKQVAMILTSAERSGNLTRKLLAFSRRGTQATTPVDCARIISDTAEILQHTCNRNIAIETDNGAGRTTVIGDDALLMNAFLNLGINASHAMPQGGTLTFTLKNTDLDRAYCAASPFDIEPGDYLWIAVRDTGCGMTPEVTAHIFEPFFTTREQGQGSGLGLAMVYGTVRQHGGAITVYSEAGTGTVFHVYLPVATDQSQNKPAAEAFLVGSGTILVIDDEELVRVTTRSLLESLGYTVLAAADGAEGIATFREHKDEIRLVILDMIMPVMGGREALAGLRAIDPDIPVLLASGFAREEDMATATEQGVSGCLLKPFRMVDLAQKVRGAIR